MTTDERANEPEPEYSRRPHTPRGAYSTHPVITNLDDAIEHVEEAIAARRRQIGMNMDHYKERMGLIRQRLELLDGNLKLPPQDGDMIMQLREVVQAVDPDVWARVREIAWPQ